MRHFNGFSYIESDAPLFAHQYSHAWFDFRGRRDGYADYFENSRLATGAHRLFCLGLSPKFPWYAENMWGITASDSRRGYMAWGGPLRTPPLRADWYDRDVVGINQGITMMMAENARTGLIWQTLSEDKSVQRGMRLAGLATQAGTA